MADEAVETQEISIADPEISQEEYKKARQEGKAVVERPIEAPVEEEETEAQTDEPEVAEEPEATEEPKPAEKTKSRGGLQKRVDKLTIKAKELEETLKRERQEREEERSKTEQQKAISTKIPNFVADPEDPRPQQGNYTDLDEYWIDLNRWVYRQEDKAKIRAAEEQRQKEISRRNEEYAKRIDEIHEKTMNEVVSKNQELDKWIKTNDWPANTPEEAARFEVFKLALKNTKLSGPVMEYYFQNQEEFDDIQSLDDPNAIVMEVMATAKKVKTGLNEAGDGKKLKIVSKAPPPIRPVSGGSSRSSVAMDEMEMNDYKNARRAGQKR